VTSGVRVLSTRGVSKPSQPQTELHVVEGCDHFGAFKEVDRIMPFVAAFLKMAASGSQGRP
jgi:hypothetical protein